MNRPTLTYQNLRTSEDVERIASEMLTNISNLHDQFRFMTNMLLTGQRVTCCDEVITAKFTDILTGICTLSTLGEEEEGQATLVAAVVNPLFRGMGIGEVLMESGINRLQEKVEAGHANGPIRIDLMTKPAVTIAEKILKKREDLNEKLMLTDHSDFNSFLY